MTEARTEEIREPGEKNATSVLRAVVQVAFANEEDNSGVATTCGRRNRLSTRRHPSYMLTVSVSKAKMTPALVVVAKSPIHR